MKQEQLQRLFKKYIQNSLTAEEAEELETYVDDPSLQLLLQNNIREEWDNFDESDEDAAQYIDEIVDDLERKVLQHIEGREKTKVVRIFSYGRYAAAVALILFSLGLFFYSQRNSFGESPSEIASNKKDITPGRNRATLILASGKSIELSEDMKGIHVTGKVIRYENGAVLLDHTAQQYLIMSVPRGGRYKLKLSDGTTVWLNAASSLKYPSTFQGDERVVEVKGEAYFEVHEDAMHPFIVKTERETIKVLGTGFNVNTYSDDRATTTLVHGQIALANSKGQRKILLPGDQAVIKGDLFTVGKVNAQDYIAWKDDLIMLNDQDVHDIFRQLERWYDVEFLNMEIIQHNKTLSGEIPSNTHLSAILQALEEQLHVKFEINGRRIMIKT